MYEKALIINSAKLGIVSGEVTPTMLNDNNLTLIELVAAGVLDGIPADPSVDGKTYSEGSSFVTYTPANGSSPASYKITLKSSTGKQYFKANVSETEINAGENPTP